MRTVQSTSQNENRLDLTVVMPVYNEGACIAEVARSWLQTLDDLPIQAKLRIYNDGSTDDTAQALASIRHDRLQVIEHTNRGHGPTVLEGYQAAVHEAEWVFQCDSDDEIPADEFHKLWDRRKDADFVLGRRTNRASSWARRCISATARLCVAALFPPGLPDVNCPFRLMRSDVLAAFLDRIPADTFAPNVLISGAFLYANARCVSVPVAYRPRATGNVSIVKWTLWRVAVRSLWQTLKGRLAFCSPRRPM